MGCHVGVIAAGQLQAIKTTVFFCVLQKMQANARKDGMVDVDGSILAEVEVDVGNIWG